MMMMTKMMLIMINSVVEAENYKLKYENKHVYDGGDDDGMG